MVAPLTDMPAAAPRNDDALMNRLNTIASRIDHLVQDGRDSRDRLDRIEARMHDATMRQREALEEVEQRIEARMQERLGESVRESVRTVLQPELSVIRPPIEAQAARLAAVESRLERVETIQVESMNALDVRFGDLAFQTRLALSAGGLVTLGAIMVVLLK